MSGREFLGRWQHVIAIASVAVAGVLYVGAIDGRSSDNAARHAEARAERGEMRAALATAVTDVAVIKQRLDGDGGMTRAEITRLRADLDRLETEMRGSLR